MLNKNTGKNQTPINQVRLTNVAYIRLNKGGKRFEIACYRNKAMNWRNKMETDISEVLQTDSVFSNVSKGMLAPQKDIQECFNTTDSIKVCEEILNKGDMQVSEQERQAVIESTFRDIATIVAEKAINPENNRSYSINMIQNAMKDIHYSVVFNKSAKQQALDVIKKLKAVMPISRASMSLRVVHSIAAEENVKSYLSAQRHSVTITGTGKTLPSQENSMLYIDIVCDPEVFRKLGTVVKDITNGEGWVEVLQLQVSSGQSQQAMYTTSTTTRISSSSDLPSTATTSSEGASTNSKVGGTISKSDESDLSMRMMLGMNVDGGDEGPDEPHAAYITAKKKKASKKDRKSEGTLQDISEEDQLVLDAYGDSSSEDVGSDASTIASDADTAPLSRDTSKASNTSLVTHPEALLPDGRPKGVYSGKKGGKKKGNKKGKGNNGSSSADTATSGTMDGGIRGGGEKKGKKSKRRELEEQQARKEKIEDLQKRFVREQENLARQRGDITSSSNDSQGAVNVISEADEKMKDDYSKKGLNLVFVDPLALDMPPPAPSTTPSVTNVSPPTAPNLATPLTSTRLVPAASVNPTADASEIVKPGLKCNTCGGNFPDAAAYRGHFKSEWHRHNLKLKMKGEPIIPTEEMFLELAPEEVIVDEMVGR